MQDAKIFQSGISPKAAKNPRILSNHTRSMLFVSIRGRNIDDPDFSFLHRLLKHRLLHVEQCLIAYVIPCVQFLLKF